MSSSVSQSSSSVIPSAGQLAASRLKQWHQNGEALLTFENLRSWINAAGLALFTPRAGQLPAPAPSMVEAVLGAPNAAPSLADTEQARTLLARLIAEGAVVPLNLLGNPTGVGTDTPDFIVATAVLPYIFTLRGDKSWKLAPETSGANKVSPLALATFNLLTERAKDPLPGLSAYDLATQLGKEVTENAVLRALTELWQHLRVLPIPRPGQGDGQPGAATLWELTTARFTKLLKAGSNAGQPTALSALVSLYLGQAIVATEEEIETFLSPLAARSRIRDVVHALMSARQLETIAVEGKTVLHVNGDLPAFLAPVSAEAMPIDDIGGLVVTTEGDVSGAEFVSADGQPRIKKFVPAPRKIGTGFITKPGIGKGIRKPFGEKNAQSGGADRTRRRPFARESNRPDRPSFTKPWAEEKADRLAGTSVPSNPRQDAEAPGSFAAAEGSSVESRPSFNKKLSFGRKPFGDKPSFGRKSFGDRPSYGAKPGFSRDRDGDSRPPRREFTPRPFGASPAGDSGDFAPRKTFSKPGTFGRKREGGFTPRASSGPSFQRDGDSRPPRREFTPRPGGDRPSRPFNSDRSARPFNSDRTARPFSSDRPARPFNSDRPSRPSFGARSDRPSFGGPREGGFNNRPSYPRRDADSGGGESTGPRFRKFDAPRGDRPSRPFNSDRPARPFSSDRPARPFNSDRPSRPASGGYAGKSGGYAGKSGSYEGKSSGGYAGKSSSFGDKKPYGKSAGGYAGKPSGGGYAGKSAGGFAGKKPFSKPGGFSGKPAGTFDKFKGNKKPFGNRPPARKWKPDESRSVE